MNINIKELVTKLIDNVESNSNISPLESNDWVDAMWAAVKRLQQSNDPDSQSKLITTFMGATILALSMSDANYAKSYSPKFSPFLYPFIIPGYNELSIEYNQKMLDLDKYDSNNRAVYIDKHMQDIGELALKHLPNSFCGALFKLSASIHGDQTPQYFFPSLAKLADDVDTLVAFCQQYPNDLNKIDADVQVTHYATAEEYLEAHLGEFISRHRTDFNSGLFGGFFSRTKIDYSKLNARDLLNHAKQKTFFGFNNRTHNVLAQMGLLDKNNDERFHEDTDESAKPSEAGHYPYN